MRVDGRRRIVIALLAVAPLAPPGRAAAQDVTWVPGSTHVVCSLTGHDETYTQHRFGLESADRGYSFQFGGQAWWLFGDSRPTARFHGRPNRGTRYPADAKGLDNDSMAESALAPPSGCPRLRFIRRGDHAYANPSVSPDPGHGRRSQVSLRVNEAPITGLELHGRMYVAFATDNLTAAQGGSQSGDFGHPTRSVMARLSSKHPLHFKGLYDLSAPAKRYAAGAKFVQVAMQQGADGTVYVWGVPGGSERAGSAYLLRMAPAALATGRHVAYFAGLSHGAPIWARSAAKATALFSDDPPCMDELGVEYDPYVARWLMLYNCTDASPGHPHGIYLRSAPQPWGPWSPPQTVFDPDPDPVARTGYCYFIHLQVTSGIDRCPPLAPNPPSRTAHRGSYYGPYFVAGGTTGSTGALTLHSSSTFAYTLDTFSPYGQMILSSSVQGPPGTTPTPRAIPPHCTGTTCF